MKPVAAVLFGSLSTLSLAALAAPPQGYVDLYYVPDAQVEEADAEGDGYGVKGSFSIAGPWFVSAEYQDVDYDDRVGDFDDDGQDDRIGLDLSQLRLGGGYRARIGGSTLAFVQAEYLDVESDADVTLSNGGNTVSGATSIDDSGYGVHAGLRGENGRLGVTLQVGFIDIGDVDGPEYEIEADYRFVDGLGVFAGYRISDLQSGATDLKLEDVRVGASLYFGG